MKAKTLIGLALLAIGLFWPQIQERIPDFIIPSRPSIDIVEPSEEIKEKVSSISSEVVDKKDRLNLTEYWITLGFKPNKSTISTLSLLKPSLVRS